jgi:hypothetical protein
MTNEIKNNVKDKEPITYTTPMTSTVVNGIQVGDEVVKSLSAASTADKTISFVSSDESVTIAPTANAGEIDFTVDIPTPPTPASQPLYRIINLREAIGWIAEDENPLAMRTLNWYDHYVYSYSLTAYNNIDLGAPAKTFLHFRLGEKMMELTESIDYIFGITFGAKEYSDDAPFYSVRLNMVYDPVALTYTFNFDQQDDPGVIITSKTVSKNNREFMFNINELNIPTNVQKYLIGFGCTYWYDIPRPRMTQHDIFNAFQFVLVYDTKF